MAEWEKFDIRDQVFLAALFTRRDMAGGWPKPGVLPPAPPPPTPTPPDDVPGLILREAWLRMDVAYNPSAALARFAGQHGLGAPMTAEFDVGGYRAQGFAGGIVFAPIDAWDKAVVLSWE